MTEIPIHKINSFREKNHFCFDNEKKNILLNLNYDSLFLRKVIETKEKQKNASKKLFEKKNQIENKNYYTNENTLKTPYESAEKENLYPINSYKRVNNSSKDYTCKRNSNLDKRNSNSNLNSKTLNKKNLICIYHKMPIKLYNGYNTPLYSQNRKYSLNKDNTEPKKVCQYLSFNGQKIFSTSTFNGLKNKTFSHTPIINNENNNNTNHNNSELFRNYYELKEKKEQIYKRKMRKAVSAEKRQILKLKNDQEIKEETINIKYNTYNNSLKKKDLIRKIPLWSKEKFDSKKDKEKKYSKTDIIKKNKDYNISGDINDDIINNYKEGRFNNFSKSFKINKIENLYIGRAKLNKDIFKKMKNNIIYNKNYYKKIDNTKSSINNNNIFKNKNNSTYKIIKYEKPHSIDLSIKNQKNLKIKAKTPDRFKVQIKLNNPKKYFVEDESYNSLFISEDKKLTIEIRSLQNVNQLFSIKKNNIQDLKMQKIINVYLGKSKKIFLNYLKSTNKPTNFKKNKNINYLSSIKEEEEKSKTELTKSETKMEEQDKNIYNKSNRLKRLGELKKKILIPEKFYIKEEFKKNKED